MRSISASSTKTRVAVCMIAILMAALSRATLAQQPLPTYLSTSDPTNKKGGIRAEKSTMLGTDYKFSLRQDFYTLGEVQYSVPNGFTRFQATVGVDDKAQKLDDEVTYVVIGIDANGTQHTLAQDTVKALQKPKLVDVSLAGINVLILRGTTATAYHSLWWGDARFEVGGGVPAAPGNNAQTVQLTFNNADFNAEIQSLVQQLEKDIAAAVGADKKTGISIAQFTLIPQPGQTLDEKIVADTQSGLNAELSKNRSLDITPYKESFSDSLKDFVVGGDLNDAARAAISKRVDDSYVVLGSIADRDTKLVIRACLYDLRSGKAIADEKGSIPITQRHILAPPTPVQAPVKQVISLMFMPDANLRVNNYQWFMDGDAKDVKPFARGAATITAFVDPGKHKFKLTWNGAGNRAQGSQKDDYQTVISDEFEIDTSKSASVELSAHIELFPRRLTLTVRSGDQRLSPKWHGP